MKRWLALIMIISLMTGSGLVFAGSWDTAKGLDKISLEGELVCLEIGRAHV